jgi:hypothetical protein
MGALGAAMRIAASLVIIGLGVAAIVFRGRFAQVEANVSKRLTGTGRSARYTRLFEWSTTVTGFAIIVLTVLYLLGFR